MKSPPPDADFSDAFDRYAPAVLLYAERRLGSREAAWDVVSDTFTTAWRHWGRHPGPPELLPWLYAIAGNSVRCQRRSAIRRQRLTVRLALHPQRRHADDHAEGVVLGQSVGGAIRRLPAADQEVLFLVAGEGQTDARSLGLALGVRPGTARSRLHRARHRLRQLLADAEPPAAEMDAVPAERIPDHRPSASAMSRPTLEA